MVGDRLGMKVGKARLSLLGLRPRQTATIITILTGTIISASTFGVLFAVSEQLRRGVFDYEEIQAARRQAEAERDAAINQQGAARHRLTQINRSLRRAIAQRTRTEGQLDRIRVQQRQTQVQLGRTQTQLNRSQVQLGTTHRQLEQIATNFQKAQAILRSVSQQAAALQAEIQQLKADRRRQITQRDQEIAEREQALHQLEDQRTHLVQDVQTLEDEFRRLRLGNPALLRNQSLASGVVRLITPRAAPQAVDELLREANRFAQERIRPGTAHPGDRVIQITNSQVEQLVNQIQGGQDYVINILSAGNYVVGEPCVLAGESCIQVYAVAIPNQVVFDAGEVVATTQITPMVVNHEGLADRVNLLIAAAQFRARQAGIVGDGIQIADGRPETVSAFFEQLKQVTQPVEVQAIASDVTYTAGPLTLELVAVQNGQVLFGTQAP